MPMWGLLCALFQFIKKIESASPSVDILSIFEAI